MPWHNVWRREIGHGRCNDNTAMQQRSPVPGRNEFSLWKSQNDEHRVYARLLPAGTGTVTTELLRLCSPGVGDEEGPVVRDELLLELERARRVKVLGVVRNDRLRDRLTDGVDLRRVSTTLHAETDVNRREGLLAGDEDGLVDLEAQDLGLEEGDGRAVDVDEAAALLSVRNSSCGL